MDIDQPSSESLNPIVGGGAVNAGQAGNVSRRLRPLEEEPSDEQLFQKFFVTPKVQPHTRLWSLGMRESYLAICGVMLVMQKWQKMFFKQHFYKSTSNEIDSRQADVFARGFTPLQPIKQSMHSDGTGDIVW